MNNIIPNSTQIPNVISDYILPRVAEAEMRCLHYICRRTFGFHKERDYISLNQFIKGLIDKNGKILDYGSGLSRASVVEGLRNLEYSKIIEVIKTRRGNSYKINLDLFEGKIAEKVADEVVHKVNYLRAKTKKEGLGRPKQGKIFPVEKRQKTGDKSVDKGSSESKPRFSRYTEGSLVSEPKVVQKVNPQNIEKQRETKNSSANEKKSGDNCESIGDILGGFNFKQKESKNLEWQDLALEIIEKIPDVEKEGKKSSIFRCCKQNSQKAKIALNDCLELGKLHVRYFLKIFNELNKAREA